MYTRILRGFLIVVVIAAALKILFALVSGLLEAQSVAGALLAFLGIPAALFVVTSLAVQFPGFRRAARRLAFGLTLLGFAVGAVALTSFVLARAHDVPAESAVLDVAGLRDAAGLALCAAGFCCWVLCAANILEPKVDDPRRSAST